MERFVAFSWKASDPAAKNRARRAAVALTQQPDPWATISASDGFLIASPRRHQDTAHCLSNNRGVILGQIFSRERYESISPGSLSENDCDAIHASNGHDLFTRFWGRYVALIQNRETGETTILRDPTGQQPCYYTNQDGLYVVFSDVNDIRGLSVVNLQPNWNRVAIHLVHARVQTSATCLTDVSELLPGEQLNVSKDGTPTRSFGWNPATFAERPLLNISSPEAAQELRGTVVACVNAWASQYQSILLRLSGGLDSAIVLGSLRQAGHHARTVCCNLVTPTEEGDERIQARAAARLAGAEIREIALNPLGIPLEKAAEVAPSPSPVLYAYNMENEIIEARLARECNADAVFSAHGGDNVFFQSKNDDSYICDHYRHHGISRDLFKIAYDTALLSRRSIWSLLRSSAQYELGNRRREHYSQHLNPADLDIVSPKALSQVTLEDLRHPWMRDLSDLPLGKQKHILSLIYCHSYRYPFDVERVADVVMPLISQPLLELCLRLPSYILCSGGRDRSLARDAFADALPIEIFQRRTKGSNSGYYVEFVVHNLKFIRQLLLDGVLAGEGLLNTQVLDQQLCEPVQIRSHNYIKILDLVSAEIWLRNGFTKRQQVAA